MNFKNLRIEMLKKWIARTPEGAEVLKSKYKRKTSSEIYFENVLKIPNKSTFFSR